MRRSGGRSRFVLSLAAIALAAGCGFLAEKGAESRGTANLPSQGIGPWVKYDQQCIEEQDIPPGASPDTSIQPVVLRSPLGHFYGEPSVVSNPSSPGELEVFYEDRTSRGTAIRRARLAMGPGRLCRPVEFAVVEDAQVFRARTDGFEAGRASAPAVLRGEQLPGIEGLDTTYAMYYAGGEAGGIGLAVSPDGRTWTRVGPDGRARGGAPEPLIVPAEDGWERGSIGSPAVLRTPAGGFLLYFDGNRAASRSIGLAASTDGVRWERIDAQGRRGAEAGPILTPTFSGPEEQTNWEFQQSGDPDSGSVGAPMVLLDSGPIRAVFVLYYTGNLRGSLLDDYDATDTSVGVASSFDGIQYRKASTEVDFPAVANEVNPALAEHFPMCLGNDDLTCMLLALQPFFDFFWGEGGYCTREENEFVPICTRNDPGDGEPGSGSSNSTSPFFIVDEAEPSVVRFGERFVLFYHQQSDASHFLDNGVAIALNNF